ncbi:MAG: putative L,D-transpeptidase ErfK/SrfK [Gammaproteobacteria bacterium]|nr:putative L,D-transpeptidase ErfK/SrfK [Gammaproteobacteria bacterium]
MSHKEIFAFEDERARKRHGLSALLMLLTSLSVSAETFVLPANGDNVIGSLNIATVPPNARAVDVAMAYDQGYQELKIANPGVDMIAHNTFAEVVVPSQYVLPDSPREGIVINVPEMRLYYYPKRPEGQPQVVVTHPVSIGREDWTTPHGVTKVVKKIENPTWVPPASIRAEHLRDWGEVLPAVVPPGPNNPMGLFKLQLGLSKYYIHGTDVAKVEGIGMRVTHGCIRMYPKDIESLFHQVEVGTPVRIVNQPIKLGRLNGALYLEAHPHLEEDPTAAHDQYDNVVNQLIKVIGESGSEVDWNQIRSAIGMRNGIPVAIGQWFHQPAGQRTADVAGEPPQAAGDQVW